MKISPYIIYLEMQPDALLVRQNFIICKNWVLQTYPLKGISPIRFRKCLGIIQGNLLLVLLHAPTLPHLPRGDSTVLCTS
jgi:hypothetical protein